MPKQKSSKVFQIMIIVLSLSYLSHSLGCLDPNQSSQKCSACQATKILMGKRCYEKMRGCLDHKVNQNNPIALLCILCQNGYLLKNDLCIRSAVVQAANGANVTQLNTPPPTSIDNPTNLTKSNITNNITNSSNNNSNTNNNNENNTNNNCNNNTNHKLPLFPQIIISSTNSQQQLKNNKLQFPQTQLLQLVSTQYPELSTIMPIQIGQYNTNTNANANMSNNIYIVIYEQGSIVTAQKLKNNSYSILSLQSNSHMQKQYKILKQQLINKLNSTNNLNITSVSLSINYQIQINSKTIFINVDLFNNKIRYLSQSNQCSPQNKYVYEVLTNTLNYYNKKKMYTMYLQYAYQQFLLYNSKKNSNNGSSNIMIGNIPQQIQRVQMLQFDNIKSNITIYNITYKLKQGESSKQYVLIKYDISSNSSEAMGYFVDGENIINLFKSMNINNTNNTTTKSSNSTDIIATNNSNNSNPASTTTGTTAGTTTGTTAGTTTGTTTGTTIGTTTGITSANNNTNTNSNITNNTNSNNSNTSNSTNNNNFNISINSNSNSNSNNNSNGVSTISPTTSPISDISNNNIAIVKPSIINSIDDILSYLNNNTIFISTVTATYKPILFTNTTNTNTNTNNNNKNNNVIPSINYKLTLLTLTSTYSVTLSQSLYTNQLTNLTITQLSSQSCMDITQVNNQITTKLDTFLKKTYPILSKYDSSVKQIELKQGIQNYIFVYYNENYKRIIIQINKIIENNKFVIGRSEIYDNGYEFVDRAWGGVYRVEGWIDDKSNTDNNNILKLASQQLLAKYKTYLSNSYITSAMSNTTHLKFFIQTKFATFQYTKIIDDSNININAINNTATNNIGQFILIEQKHGFALPIGYKKQNLMNNTCADYNGYKKIYDYLSIKYKTYFGGTTPEIYGLRMPGLPNYQFIFKTILGFYSLTATPISSTGTLTTSSLKKIVQPIPNITNIINNSNNNNSNNNIASIFSSSPASTSSSTPTSTSIINDCNSLQKYSQIDQKCYKKIVNCYRQIGSICVMCELGFVLQDGLLECKKSCKW